MTIDAAAQGSGAEQSEGQGRPFYITTPIYYVNDRPHIGHAYTTLACDVVARFKRLDGFDAHFLTGTDEHGQKVEKAAADAGVSPKEFTDRVSETFRALPAALNFSNDDFIRTTEERHIRSSQAIWKALLDAGDIYLGSYAGWYAVRDEAFYGENELTKQPDGNVQLFRQFNARRAFSQIDQQFHIWRRCRKVLSTVACRPVHDGPASRH